MDMPNAGDFAAPSEGASLFGQAVEFVLAVVAIALLVRDLIS